MLRNILANRFTQRGGWVFVRNKLFPFHLLSNTQLAVRQLRDRKGPVSVDRRRSLSARKGLNHM